MSKLKRKRFVKVAEFRVNRVLEYFRLIGNLSNKNNYSYTDDDVAKIRIALQNKLDETMELLEDRVQKTETFKLEGDDYEAE
tara:strand:- start:1161 stop:1406 length:246 start_codon:yes stop_codon:yes gene_type:complete